MTLRNADTLSADFDAPTVAVTETLTFELRATDDDGASTTDRSTVTVEPAAASNLPPAVDAGAPQTVVAGDVASLTGSATDPDGVVASVQWTQISGSPVTLRNADALVAEFDAPMVMVSEILTFELRATDDDGASSVDRSTVTVEPVPPVNQPPTVDAGADQTVPEGSTVSLTAIANDPDGVIQSYAWTQIGGPAVTLQGADTSAASFDAPATTSDLLLEFRVEVTDDAGAPASDTIRVTVQPVNAPPVADAGADQTVQPGVTVTLDGSAANDSDGNIEAYLWEQLNGTPVTLDGADTAIASFTAPQPQPLIEDLVFRLTVTDDEGADGSDLITVTVDGNSAPQVQSENDKNAFGGQILAFYVTATDPDGPIPVLTADLGDLPAGNDAVFTDLGDGHGYFSWTTREQDVGVYMLDFTAVDGDFPSSSSVLQVQADIVAITAGNVILQDDFDTASLSGWTIIDESGQGASWLKSGGEFVQGDEVYGLSQAYDLGSFAFRNATAALTDYRVSIEIAPRGEEGDSVGLMFRYQGPDDYYRVTLNRGRGFARLEKRVNGVFTTLAANQRAPVGGDPIDLHVVVTGSLMQVFVDGDPLFSASDTDHAVGGIALFTQEAVGFDTLRVSEIGTQPALAIERPIAHGVTSGGTQDISVTAVVTGTSVQPQDIAVSVDGGDCGSVTEIETGRFNAVCAVVAAGDHEYTAVLAAPGVDLARDTNTQAAIAGPGGAAHRYDALGDSITEGLYDFYSTDNLEPAADRTRAYRSWTNVFSSGLEESLAAPNLVANEGFPGDTTDEYLAQRLDGVLERAPDADRSIILLGTNDSNVSLCPAQSCASAYRANLRGIINGLRAAGRDTIYVGLLPPAWGRNTSSGPYPDPLDASAERNLNIIALNDEIRSLVNASNNPDVFLGPDLFGCFLTPTVNRFSMFEDVLHPNGLGYAQFAELWKDVILNGPPGPGPCVLPLYHLEDLDPYEYKQNLIEVGDRYYTDQSFVVESIPVELEHGVWIMTADADRNRADNVFLSFDVGTAPVDVYLAYDPQGSPPVSPDATFQAVTPTGTLAVSDARVGTLALQRASGFSGLMRLGGNHSLDATADVMYLVVIVPQ